MGRIQTEQTKEKIRQSLLKYPPPFIRECPSCNTKITYTCRHHVRRAERDNHICRKYKVGNEMTGNHFSLMGRKSVAIQSENRRSKNEIHFADLCKKNFSGVETNKPIFNGWDCDVILADQKVAVMWNGKWHYEKITKKHSVSQVQNRDKIKLNEIIKAGYTPYVIKDVGREDKSFVESEFRKFQIFITGA